MNKNCNPFFNNNSVNLHSQNMRREKKDFQECENKYLEKENIEKKIEELGDEDIEKLFML